ncbi:MAG: ATPase [Alphaproteobacteria bacterium HGW-Alphaproteobacteria-2]|nr:MAG: ATPase [Alphaproteobacteria bacterium HGW-Alphaproteobacteria-2]
MNIHTGDVMAPAAPRSMADTGLNPVMMRDILLKTVFRMNLDTVSAIARATALPLPVAQELVDMARTQKLIEAMGNLHAASGQEMTYQLSEAGRARALDALTQSEYYGAMPVPMATYYEQTRRQSVRNMRITPEMLRGSMGHLILPEGLLAELGPAVASGRSILLYGPPGNGKSAISNGIRDALGDQIYVPRAIEYAGQVITVFDPIVHNAVALPKDDPRALRRTDNRFDQRYILCQRPSVMTGGELTLDMLDLKYNVVSRTYQASLQLKATGGVFIVDDLGRQVEPPQSIINRWIVPMEAGYDILALQSGEKFEVPFDTLVIFSTNFHPNEMFDGAALRRIFFKIKIDGPNQADFLKVFAMVAKKKNLALDEDALVHLIRGKFLPYRMTPDLIDRAWANLFVKQETIAH